MRKVLDSQYLNLIKALQKVELQISNNHFEKRAYGWTFKIRTFCSTGSIQVKLRLEDKLVEVMGVSHESPDEAVLDLIEKLSKGLVEVSSSNGKNKKVYRFDKKTLTFIEVNQFQEN